MRNSASLIKASVCTLFVLLHLALGMMTLSNGNIFRVTDPLRGEFTGDRLISSHKGQWSGALIFSLICASINGWVNNREAGDLRRHLAHYDVSVMDSDECSESLMRSRHLISNSNCIATEWARFSSKAMGDRDKLTRGTPQVQLIIHLGNKLTGSKCQL